MYSIVGIVILVLDILAILDCIKSGKEPGQKLLWILLILILPPWGWSSTTCSAKARAPDQGRLSIRRWPGDVEW